MTDGEAAPGILRCGTTRQGPRPRRGVSDDEIAYDEPRRLSTHAEEPPEPPERSYDGTRRVRAASRVDGEEPPRAKHRTQIMEAVAEGTYRKGGVQAW